MKGRLGGVPPAAEALSLSRQLRAAAATYHGALPRRARRDDGGRVPEEGTDDRRAEEEEARRRRRARTLRGDGAHGGEDGVPGRPAGARVHGAVRAQDGEVRGEEAGGAGEGGEGGVGVGLRELRGRVAAGDAGAHARAAAAGGARGAAVHAAPRRAGAVPAAVPADAVGLRVQRGADRALLPLARRPLGGGGGGGRRRPAAQRGAHRKVPLPGEQRLRGDVRQHVQGPHAGLLHQRVRAPPHHEPKFRRHELRDDIRPGAASVGRGPGVEASLLPEPLFHVDAICPGLSEASVGPYMHVQSLPAGLGMEKVSLVFFYTEM